VVHYIWGLSCKAAAVAGDSFVGVRLQKDLK